MRRPSFGRRLGVCQGGPRNSRYQSRIRQDEMKPEIHPEYNEITVRCVCGNTFKTRSTAEGIELEICSNCHPYYTGKQKLVDTAGRVERFRRRYAQADASGAAEKSPAEDS